MQGAPVRPTSREYYTTRNVDRFHDGVDKSSEPHEGSECTPHITALSWVQRLPTEIDNNYNDQHLARV